MEKIMPKYEEITWNVGSVADLPSFITAQQKGKSAITVIK